MYVQVVLPVQENRKKTDNRIGKEPDKSEKDKLIDQCHDELVSLAETIGKKQISVIDYNN